MAIIKETSLDTIIHLIKEKHEQKKQVEKAAKQIDEELQALYSQARSALDGTGMALVVMDSFAGTVVTGPKLAITKIEDLRVGDKVRVKAKFGVGEWQTCTVEEIEEDGAGFGVVERLSDGWFWVDTDDDQWEFVSRP